MFDVSLAGCDHLIGDLDKEGGHALGGVVILRYAVDHSNSIHQAGDVLHHGSLGR